jgi:hypothetical protein
VFELLEAGCVCAETCRMKAQIKIKGNCYADCIVYYAYSNILDIPSLESILSLKNLIQTFTLYFCSIYLGITFCHTCGSIHVLKDTMFCALAISASELPSFCMIDNDCRRYFLGKAISLQAWTDPKGSKSLRLPDFKTIGT